MTLKIDGTYKSKTYIDLWIVKIQTGWKTIPFSWSQVLPADKGFSKPINGTPFVISVGTHGSHAEVSLAYNGFDIFEEGIDLSGSLKFHSEPIKGVIVEGVASLL